VCRSFHHPSGVVLVVMEPEHVGGKSRPGSIWLIFPQWGRKKLYHAHLKILIFSYEIPNKQPQNSFKHDLYVKNRFHFFWPSDAMRLAIVCLGGHGYSSAVYTFPLGVCLSLQSSALDSFLGPWGASVWDLGVFLFQLSNASRSPN